MKPYNHRIGVFVGDTGAPRGEPNCLTVSLEGVAFVEKISGKSAKDACEKIVASETKRMSKKLMDAIVADKDARIAELTAEVELMRSSLRLFLSSASSWEERASLHRKRSDDYSAGIYQSLEGCAEEIQDITRNALKDGV